MKYYPVYFYYRQKWQCVNSYSLLLATVPQFEVVGSFNHVLDCVKDVAGCKPDILLMDIEMPGMTGIEAVIKIKKEFIKESRENNSNYKY